MQNPGLNIQESILCTFFKKAKSYFLPLVKARILRLNLCKNVSCLLSTCKSLKERMTKKTYLALARGKVREDEFEVNAPIGRHPVVRAKMTVREDGRKSLTRFKVLRRFGNVATLLMAFPKTGRTHQIRVHLKHIGHPIMGDEVYGKAGLDKIYGISRHMLHALRLGFFHPKTGEWMEFVAPVPDDFKRAIVNVWKAAEGGENFEK
jgi:23S rRNA pseudouridine1911/1915/1917 synthase